jgi:malonyl CoA-acyl carrier protein transacylase
MSKVYMFPGQGSQELGMGQDLFDKFREEVAQADEVLGYSVKDLCCNGPLEKPQQAVLA